MDDQDLLGPTDVLAKLPKDFHSNLESKKWTDRRDALQLFIDLLEKYPELEQNARYAGVVNNLRSILEKDSNVNVCSLSVKCLKLLADRLGSKFGPLAVSVMPVVFEKFKEKKAVLREPLVQCADAIRSTVNIEFLQDDIIAAMNKPNPCIKAQTDLFLHRAFKYFNSTTISKKLLKALAPVLVKHTGDPDAEVREAACAALGSAMRAIGEQPMMGLLENIPDDKMKMNKIKVLYQQILDEVGPNGLQDADSESTSISASAAAAIQNKYDDVSTAVSDEADPFDLLDPVNIFLHLPQDFYVNLVSQKWTDRRDALQKFLDLLEKNPKLDPDENYEEIICALKTILWKDSNINVCALSAKCLKGLADGLRAKFGPHAVSVIPVLFEKFKEKKSVLRDQIIECIDAINLTVDIELLCGDIIEAMNKTNPSIKAQTDLFILRAFKYFNNATMPKKMLKAVVAALLVHTGDSAPEVREAAYAAIGSAMRIVGEKPMMVFLTDIAEDKTKMEKIKDSYQKILEEVGPNGLHCAHYDACQAKRPTAPENSPKAVPVVKKAFKARPAPKVVAPAIKPRIPPRAAAPIPPKVAAPTVKAVPPTSAVKTVPRNSACATILSSRVAQVKPSQVRNSVLSTLAKTDKAPSTVFSTQRNTVEGRLKLNVGIRPSTAPVFNRAAVNQRPTTSDSSRIPKPPPKNATAQTARGLTGIPLPARPSLRQPQ